ncbi:hypothetical protein A1D31_24415 [Bradyrhizobium liaoningense]|nr:hypothetical protein A1D31_24415 [Bradyrhizobium liaoningense]
MLARRKVDRRQARLTELDGIIHQPLYVGVGVGSLRCHGLDDFDDADAGLPCAAGRSNARKAF